MTVDVAGVGSANVYYQGYGWADVNTTFPPTCGPRPAYYDVMVTASPGAQFTFTLTQMSPNPN